MSRGYYTKKERSVDLVLLMLITVLFVADQAILIPNYLLIEKEFGIKHGQMGAVSSIFIVIGRRRENNRISPA